MGAERLAGSNRRREVSCMWENGFAFSLPDEPMRAYFRAVRLKTPLPPELADTPVEGLEYDSRRVGNGFLFFAFPGARADGRAFAAGRDGSRGSRHRQRIPRSGRLAQPLDPGGARPPFPGPRLPELLRPAGPAPATDRHHRHERQNHYGISGRFRAAGGRQNHRDDRHHRVSSGFPKSSPRSTPHRSRSTCTGSSRSCSKPGGTHVTMEVSSHALALGGSTACASTRSSSPT